MSAPTRKGFNGLIKRGPMAADVIGRDFTMVFNAAVRDRRLSRRARGLLVEILSHRDGFGVSEAALIAGGPEGRDAIRKALRELEEYGYLHRSQPRDGGKFTEVVFEVTDMPQGLLIGAEAPWEDPAGDPEQNRRSAPSPENPSTVGVQQNRRSAPSPEKPSTAKPSTANPQHKKTNSSCGAEDDLSPGRHTGDTSQRASTGERDAATPEGAVPEPRSEQPETAPAARIARRWAAERRAQGLVTSKQRVAALAREAEELLAAGQSAERLEREVSVMAEHPTWVSLVRHMESLPPAVAGAGGLGVRPRDPGAGLSAAARAILERGSGL